MIHLLLAAVIYVAPDGSDRAAGTKEKPFATVARALEAARGPATIYLRGGVYVLSKGIEFTPQASGTTLEAHPNEAVRLIGGRILPGAKPRAGTAIVEYDLSALPDLGELRPRGFGRPVVPAHAELFFGGRRMTLARWPNGDFARIAAAADPDPPDDGHGRKLGRLEHGFLYEGDRPARWRDTSNIWVHGYWAWDWAETYERIELLDAARRLIRTAAPRGSYGFRAGQRFYFLNVLEELDRPGEYFVDRAARKLYFWPPAGASGAETAISVLEEPMIRVRGASRVVIRGLTLEYTRGHGIVVEDGEDVRIESCTVRNTGNAGVIVRGGKRHTVDGCDVYQTGDGGIELTGGDRRTLTPAGHAALNNDIHDMGEWSKTYHPAIKINGVGNRLAHNLIHNGPHAGILLTGNEHIIEYNELHHLARETGDVGAFYLGRDWTERGNVVRYNYFHHMGGVNMGSMAVYLDDCASGATVFGNIFYKVTRAAFIGGGRDNRVENNIFVETSPAVHVDARCTDPRPVWHNMTYQTMKQRLEAMDHRRPPYIERYPELAKIEPYLAGDKGVPPEGNRIARNLVSGAGAADGKWIDTRWRVDRAWLEMRDNVVEEDLGFRDPEARDFTLKDDAAARRIGFERIPIEKIGPQRGK